MKKKSSFGFMINTMFMAIIIPMVIVALAGFQLAQISADSGERLYTGFGKVQGDIGMGYAYFQDIKIQLRNTLYLYEGNTEKQQSAISNLEDSKKQMNTLFDDAAANMADDEGKDYLAEARTYVSEYLDDVDSCLTYFNNNQLEAARKHLIDNGVASANAADKKIDDLLAALDERASEELTKVETTTLRGEVIIIALVIFSLIDVIVAIRYMNRNVRNSVKEISAASEKVSAGDINIELPKENPIKELDDLLQAMRHLSENLNRQAEALLRISDGDLRIDFRPASEKDVVGNAIVRLVEDDNSIMNNIRNATNQISIGSSQIAAVSQTLAQGSTQQASAIEQITASITDIASQTKGNAEQADEVNRIVLEAKEDVTAGNARMEEMVVAMNEINEASENIQKIIKVIDDIAFNTNILALNATVEAARAGEQGKGFAVVAEEVRNLAGRSAEASSQTAEMIEDSIRKVRRGGELAKQMEEALEVISNMIERITGLSEDIAKTSNDQATATAQIDQALMQVSQVVQTNSATSEQCASASEELSGQARGLNQELERFRLKDIIGNMPSQSLGYEETPLLDSENRY